MGSKNPHADAYTLRWHQHIDDVPQEAWDALAQAQPTPLLEWEWLHQLEASGSISAETGWLPCHLTLWKGNDLRAAAPLYVKSHSIGEFVWDHVWADVAHQLGSRYYPKLVGMSPVTPAVGYRFLIAPGEDEEAMTATMLRQIQEFCDRNDISGCAFNFVDEQWRSLIEGLGYTSWRHQSFGWTNDGFRTFDDYLGRFNKNQRKNIRRERRSMEEQGLELRTLTGDEIPEHYFSIMYRYYRNTNEQFGMWAARYLNREFFLRLAGFRHRILLVTAHHENTKDDPVAMSFLLTKGDVLIGRYWGSAGFYNHLHFNACYYRPIQWAIENGIRWFDPGAGSSHKIRRGFRAVANHSLHWFRDRQLSMVMNQYIDQVNDSEQEHIEHLNGALPFAR